MAWNNNPYNNMVNNGMPMNGYTPSYTPQVGYSNIQPSIPLNQYTQQPQPQQIAQNVAIQGRMVTSKEEALATPVDFSGNPIFLADLGHKKIFMKKLNMNTGASDLFEFVLNETPQKSEEESANIVADNFASKKDFRELNETISEMQNTIDSLQKEIDRLKKPVNSSAGKVAKKNESGNE